MGKTQKQVTKVYKRQEAAGKGKRNKWISWKKYFKWCNK